MEILQKGIVSATKWSNTLKQFVGQFQNFQKCTLAIYPKSPSQILITSTNTNLFTNEKVIKTFKADKFLKDKRSVKLASLNYSLIYIRNGSQVENELLESYILKFRKTSRTFEEFDRTIIVIV